MAARLLALGLKSASSNGKRVIPMGAAGCHHQSAALIGNREIVGHGFNGQQNYCDRVDYPMSAVRFKENTPDIVALREKEKGDWHKLSKEEKKTLYRASFCQTFSEMKAPSGEWKSSVGLSLFAISLSLWVYMGLQLFVYQPLPESFSEESQKAQLKRMLELEVNPVDGLASKWDYEKQEWKK